jgi:hypothetical protein
MNLTPELIRKTYKATPPYQVIEAMSNFIGQKVSWELEFSSVIKQEGGKVKIMSMSVSEESIVPEVVWCEVEESDFPMVKVLVSGTKLRLAGEISNITNLAIDIASASLQIVSDDPKQIYLPEGSRLDLINFLRAKLLGAKIVKICDNYPSADQLEILELTGSDVAIQVLGQNIDTAFMEKAKGFKLYFKRNLEIKKTNSVHARFYIIDDEVFQVDSSLRNSGGNKATIINKLEEAADQVRQDFEEWWSKGEVVD